MKAYPIVTYSWLLLYPSYPPDKARALMSFLSFAYDEVVLNMLEGYALVDRLISDRVDIFEIGHSSSWLQLNATVLCSDRPHGTPATIFRCEGNRSSRNFPFGGSAIPR